MNKIHALCLVALIITTPFAPVLAEDRPGTIQERDYQNLSSCASTLHNLIYPTQDRDQRYSVGLLRDDLIVILDAQNNDLYVFTPTYAGKTDLTHDKNGAPIIEGAHRLVSFPKEPGQTPPVTNDVSGTYNLRIPYKPDGLLERKGYYYLVIDDDVFEGAHHSRILFISGLLGGDAQDTPNFSTGFYKGHQMITGPGFSLENRHYHSIELEDHIWDTNSKNHGIAPDAVKALGDELAIGMSRLGAALDGKLLPEQCTLCMPEPGLDISQVNKLYTDLISSCTSAARQLHLESLLAAIDDQKNDDPNYICTAYNEAPFQRSAGPSSTDAMGPLRTSSANTGKDRPLWKWSSYKIQTRDFLENDINAELAINLTRLKGSIDCQALYTTLLELGDAMAACKVNLSPVVQQTWANWTIDPSGHATGFTGDHDCLAAQLQQLTYPKPLNGQSVQVGARIMYHSKIKTACPVNGQTAPLQKFSSEGAYLGALPPTQFNIPAALPSKIIFDKGNNVYATEYGIPRFYKFDAKGTFISKVDCIPGQDRTGLTLSDITLDGTGNVWLSLMSPLLADKQNNKLLGFSPEGTKIGEVILNSISPMAFAIDGEGDFWVLDRQAEKVQKITSKGQVLFTLGGFGNFESKVTFRFPNHLLIDAQNNVYIADSSSTPVRKFNSQGNLMTDFSLRSDADTPNLSLGNLALDKQKNIYAIDYNRGVILKFDSTGKFLKRFGRREDGASYLNRPTSLSVDENNDIWLVDKPATYTQMCE